MDDDIETIRLSPRAFREALLALARAWTGLPTVDYGPRHVGPDMAISLAVSGARWDSMLGIGEGERP